MKIAFYKHTKSGINGVYNRGVKWIENGKYSHCELIFSNGLSASSSFMDGGVRFKDIAYDEDKWDIFDVSWADEKYAMEYFVKNLGKPYNVVGNIHFLFGFVRGDTNGLFCSEACAEALGLINGWQFAPNALAHIIMLVNEKEKQMKRNFAETGNNEGL
jgi:hypothetical protein